MAEEKLDRPKVLLTQYQSFLDIYKHHFDLFLKGILGYLASISVMAGFIFRTETSKYHKIALSVVIPLASLVAFLGCLKSRRWVLDLQSSIDSIEGELKVQPFPFSGPKGIILTAIVISLGFFGFGIVNIVLQVIWG
jgi:hypothetical protein